MMQACVSLGIVTCMIAKTLLHAENDATEQLHQDYWIIESQNRITSYNLQQLCKRNIVFG